MQLFNADVKAIVNIRIQSIVTIVEVFIANKNNEEFVLLGQDVIALFNMRIYNDINLGSMSSGEHVEWFPIFGNKDMAKYETRYLGPS